MLMLRSISAILHPRCGKIWDVYMAACKCLEVRTRWNKELSVVFLSPLRSPLTIVSSLQYGCFLAAHSANPILHNALTQNHFIRLLCIRLITINRIAGKTKRFLMQYCWHLFTAEPLSTSHTCRPGFHLCSYSHKRLQHPPAVYNVRSIAACT